MSEAHSPQSEATTGSGGEGKTATQNSSDESKSEDVATEGKDAVQDESKSAGGSAKEEGTPSTPEASEGKESGAGTESKVAEPSQDDNEMQHSDDNSSAADDTTAESDRLPEIKPRKATGLNDFELTALQGLFDVYDKSGVGYITKAELIDLTEHIKQDAEAARDFAEPLHLDREDEQVSFDQFAGLVANHPDKALRNLIIHAGVVEFLQILTKYQRECEQQNNFMEAQRAAQQIKVLRQQEEGRQQMRLIYAQKQEKYDAAQARNEQVQLFNEKWDKYLQEFDRQAQDYIRELSEKHKSALIEFRHRKMAELTRKAPKFSKKLLALRHKQETHSRLKQYIDAKRVQDEADDLEDAELAKIERKRRKQYNKLEKNFRAEQNKELMALVDKIHMRREEHLSQRARDLVRLKQRNKNMKAVIQGRQAAQKKFAAGAVKFSLDLKAKRPEHY